MSNVESFDLLKKSAVTDIQNQLEAAVADFKADAEKHAQQETSFTDSDGVSYDQGAKGWSIVAENAADAASTSETNAQSSASTASSEADRSKTEADRAQSIADDIDAMNVITEVPSAGYQVTVGSTGDYATINAALDALTRYKNTHDIPDVTIMLQDGFVMEEQVLVNDEDLSWIHIEYEGTGAQQDIESIGEGQEVTASVAEVTDVTVESFSNNATDIQGGYVVLNQPNETHYFWINVDDNGTDPEPEEGGTPHEVSAFAGDTESEVASKLNSAINGVTGFTTSIASSTITVTNDDNGDVANATSSDGISSSVVTEGVDAEYQVQFTITGHGLANGDRIIVRFHEGSLEEQNYDGIWTINEVTTDTFEIDYSDPDNEQVIYDAELAGTGSTGVVTELSTVEVDRNSMDTNWEFFYYPAFGVTRGQLPTIACLFEMNESALPAGVNEYQSYLDGLCATDLGRIHVKPFCGFINAHGTNFYGTRNSELNGNDGIFDRGGRHGIWAYANTTINARRASASNCGWVAKDLGKPRIDEIDEISGSGVIATRASHINFESGVATGNYADNVHSEHGSTIVTSYAEIFDSEIGEDEGYRYGGTITTLEGSSMVDYNALPSIKLQPNITIPVQTISGEKRQLSSNELLNEIDATTSDTFGIEWDMSVTSSTLTVIN